MKRTFTIYPSNYIKASESVSSEQPLTEYITPEQLVIIEKLGKPLSTIITDSFRDRMTADSDTMKNYYDGRISGMAAVLFESHKITGDEYWTLLDR